MPRGDGTGPNGQGPMTGRGMGYCAGFEVPGFMNPVGFRRGFGRGMGFGRGFRARTFMQPIAQPIQPQVITETQEKQFLETELKEIEAEKQEIEKRLKELKIQKK